MSLEFWSTAASIGTFIVIAATAIAAVIQLRHLRASNQFGGMLTVLERFQTPTLVQLDDYCRSELQIKMQDSQFRKSLDRGKMKLEEHPEAQVFIWYEWAGTMVKRGLLPEGAFMDLFAPR